MHINAHNKIKSKNIFIHFVIIKIGNDVIASSKWRRKRRIKKLEKQQLSYPNYYFIVDMLFFPPFIPILFLIE